MTSTSPQHTTPIAADIRSLAERLEGERPTLLAVWAHPDDESFLAAGLMAAVAERGGRVVNVSATLGEHGTDDPVALPPERLARIRRRELDAALGELGAEAPVLLGHIDGTVERIPTALGARQVATVVDEVRPDAVVTFGHDGVTGHADHRAIARWVEQVVDTRPELPVLTTAVGTAWPADVLAGMHRVSVFYPGYPQRPAGGAGEVVRVSDELLERKLAALAAHESQVGPLWAELGAEGYRRMAAVEAYRPANVAGARLLDPAAEARTAA